MGSLFEKKKKIKEGTVPRWRPCVRIRLTAIHRTTKRRRTSLHGPTAIAEPMAFVAPAFYSASWTYAFSFRIPRGHMLVGGRRTLCCAWFGPSVMSPFISPVVKRLLMWAPIFAVS